MASLARTFMRFLSDTGSQARGRVRVREGTDVAGEGAKHVPLGASGGMRPMRTRSWWSWSSAIRRCFLIFFASCSRKGTIVSEQRDPASAQARRKTDPLGELERLRLDLLLFPRRLNLYRVLDVEGDGTCRVLDLVRTLEDGVVRSRSEDRLIPPLDLWRSLSLRGKSVQGRSAAIAHQRKGST